MARALDADEQLAMHLQAVEMSKALQTSMKPTRTIPAEYICPVCRHLLTAPLQTPCGHLVCSSCLDQLIEENGDPAPCPHKEVDCDWLSRKQGTVFLDKHIEKEIEKVRNSSTTTEHSEDIPFLEAAYLDLALEELNVDCQDSGYASVQDRQSKERSAARVDRVDHDSSSEGEILASAMGGARRKRKGRTN